MSKVPKRSEGHCQSHCQSHCHTEGHCQTARLLSDRGPLSEPLSEGHCQTARLLSDRGPLSEPLSEGHCQTARLLSDTQGNGGAEHLFHSYEFFPSLRYYFKLLRKCQSVIKKSNKSVACVGGGGGGVSVVTCRRLRAINGTALKVVTKPCHTIRPQSTSLGSNPLSLLSLLSWPSFLWDWLRYQ